MADKKAWSFWLGEDTIALLDGYAQEWGVNRSAALTMIIKTVIGGKPVVGSPTDSVKISGVLSGSVATDV